MRRVLALAAVTAVVLSAGCGGKRYEERMNLTLEQMRYRKRLDDNLNPAVKGKVEQNLIFLRPPKGLSAEPAKAFMLAELEPGKFDVAESFLEKDKQYLHVLARVKGQKGPAGKKAAPSDAAQAVRGDFTTDVLQILSAYYNLDLDPSKAKEESKPPRNNKFKHLTFEANGKNVQMYVFGTKATQHEVALIFEYPKSEQGSLIGKIELTLGSFAVGERARRAFSGSVGEEEGEGGAPASVAF
jgi:hypothetical protein